MQEAQERLAEMCAMRLGPAERAERTLSILAADRIARALGTTLSEMFKELEREARATDCR